MQASILEGIRVVDLTRVLTGPYCSMMLGDMGADVIKVERPNGGDDTRKWGPPFIEEESIYYLSINRNKRSMTLDLKTEAGRDILWQLIEEADVVLENFRPGAIARLGFDYETVRQRCPNIIYGSISGFGQEGPGRNLTAYDLIVQGMSGLMSLTGPQGKPTKFGIPIADLTAGMFMAYAVMGALFHRQRTGQGQYIDTSLLGGQVALLVYYAGIFWATGQAPTSVWNAHNILSPYQTFQTQDGHVNVACGNDKLWGLLCEALDLEDLFAEPAFADNAGRIANVELLAERIEGVLGGMKTAVVLEKLNAVGVPCGPIHTIEDVFANPQVDVYQLHQQVPHPTIGTVDQLGFPYHLSQTPCEIKRPPPTLGQHTAEILAEIGYDDEAIAALQEDKVV